MVEYLLRTYLLQEEISSSSRSWFWSAGFSSFLLIFFFLIFDFFFPLKLLTSLASILFFPYYAYKYYWAPSETAVHCTPRADISLLLLLTLVTGRKGKTNEFKTALMQSTDRTFINENDNAQVSFQISYKQLFDTITTYGLYIFFLF